MMFCNVLQLHSIRPDVSAAEVVLSPEKTEASRSPEKDAFAPTPFRAETRDLCDSVSGRMLYVGLAVENMVL